MKIGSIFYQLRQRITKEQFQESPNIRFEHAGVSPIFLNITQPFPDQSPGSPASDQERCPKDFSHQDFTEYRRETAW